MSSDMAEPEQAANSVKLNESHLEEKSLKRPSVDFVDAEPVDGEIVRQRTKVAKKKTEKVSSKPLNKPPSAEQVLYETIKKRLHVIGGDGIQLRLSISTGENGGLGLFALKNFAIGEPITAFCGEIVPHDVAEEEDRSPLRMRRIYPMRYEIDGKRMPDKTPITNPVLQLIGHGAAAYAYDARSAEKNNAKFRELESPDNIERLDEFVEGAHWALNPSERIMYIVATKPIAKGEEIFADWGVGYWARQQDAADSE